MNNPIHTPLPSPKKTAWRNIPNNYASIGLVYIFAESEAGRDAWISRLQRIGFNFFVKFHDVRSRFALQATDHHLEGTGYKILPIIQ